MSTHYFCNVDEAYKVALKVEEKIDRRLRQKFQGKWTRGKGKASVANNSEKEDEATNIQNTRGGSGARGGKGFVIGK